MTATIAVLALLYSALRFLHTGVVTAWANFGGDLLCGWPGYYVTAWNPAIYVGSLSEYWWEAPYWNYGPVQHLVYLPFTFVPDLRMAYRAILFICYGYVLLSFLMTWRLNLRVPKSLGVFSLLVLLWANFLPLYEALIQRNVELIELVCLTFGYAMFIRRRDGLAGAALGIATMTKFLPGIFLPYFVWKRRWRCVGGFFAAAVPLAVLAQLTLGWQYNFLVKDVNGVVEMFARDSYLNQALSGLIMRLGPWLAPALSWPTVASLASVAMGLFLAAVLVRYGRPGAERWEWSLLLLTMIMVSPRAQAYYYVFLLVPFSFLAEDILHRALTPGWLAAAVGAWWLIAWPIPLSFLERWNPGGPHGLRVIEVIWNLSLPLIGALLLTVVVCRRLMQAAGTPVRVT